jgi:hypothetical protein
MKKTLFLLFLSIQGFFFSQTWLPPLGQGVDGGSVNFAFVETIIKFQDDIVIAGEFQSVSGVSANYVAKWNGSTWSAMGTGLPTLPKCLAIYNNELYAGLDDIGSSTLYKWNGTAWIATGPFNNPILTMYVDENTNEFYVGGSFTSPGKYISKWNGTSWVGIGNLATGNANFPGVRSIFKYKNELYVGGTFGAGTSTQYIAKFNGTSFVGLSSDQPNQLVNTMVEKDGKLFIGGAFSRVGPSGSPLTPSVIKWNGTGWEALTENNTGPVNSFGGVKSLTIYKNQVYATGSFASIFNTDPNLTVNNIARFNDCQWKDLNDGLGSVGLAGNGNCMAVIDETLYIGGEFLQAGTISGTARIAKWSSINECPDPVCFPLNPIVTINTTQLTTCSGSNVNFTSQVINGGSNPSYQWQVNGSNAGTNSPNLTINNVTSNSTVTLAVISNDPCMINPNATSNPITINIVTEIIPTINIVASQTNICSGTNVSFTANATGGGVNPNYQWKVNANNVGSNNPNYNYQPEDGDQVTCDYTSSESCASPSLVSSTNLTMNVTDTPSGNVSVSGNTISAEQSGASYQWINCGTGNTNITGATQQTYTPTNSGNYAVRLSIGNCITTSECTTVNIVGLDDKFQNPFKIYPNPANEKLFVSIENNDLFSISLSEINGKLIFNKKDLSNLEILDIDKLIPGFYLLKLETSSKSYYQQVIKMK